MKTTGRSRNLGDWCPWLLALLLLPLVAQSAVAQEERGGTPTEEPSSYDTLFEQTAGQNIIQEANMAYGAGERSVKKADKLKKKAAGLEGEERAKLEERAAESLESAVASFSEAIAKNPKLHKAYVALAEVLLEQERFADSISVYTQALEMKPQDWSAIYGRAEAFVGLDDLRNAVAAYQQLRSGDPQRAQELLGSIKGWLEYQRANPGEFGEDALEEVARWVEEQERSSS